jgi:hypothetical protein
MSARLTDTANSPIPPANEILELACLIAYAQREGKELHIERNGTTTIEGSPVSEFFAPSSRFMTGDLVDLPSLANKLKSSADPVSAYLKGQLSEATMQALAKYRGWFSDPVPLQKGLLGDLNKIIRGKSVFEAQRFAHIRLRPATRALLAQTPQADTRVLLNRRLIEDAYPLEISRKLYKSPGDKKLAAVRNESPSDGFSNIFRLEDGCWRLKFGGIEVPREPDLGLHYCHKLIQQQPNDVTASRLVTLVNGEPVAIMEEKDILGCNIATYEVPSSSGADNTEARFVTSEFLDEIISDEDRIWVMKSIASLKDEAATMKANGKVFDAAVCQNDAVQLQNWLERHAPETDGNYFESRSRRDRKSVSIAITRTIKRLEKSHPPLAAHLRESIHKGSSCSYRPKNSISWVL